jgi:hypothetical protein
VLWNNYVRILRHPDYLLLAIIPALNFAGFFVYIASAPTFLVDLLGVSSYGFAWLFVPMIAGVMCGALISGRSAGRLSATNTVKLGYALMFAAVAFDLGVAWFVAPGVPRHALPIMLYTMGSSVVMPTASLLMIDLFPTMRGLASSLQGSSSLRWLRSMPDRSRRCCAFARRWRWAAVHGSEPRCGSPISDVQCAAGNDVAMRLCAPYPADRVV